MNFKEYIKNKLESQKDQPLKKILFIDGTDQRAKDAFSMHQKDKLLKPLLLVKTAAETSSEYDYLIMEEWQVKEKELIDKYLERRKGKETLEQARKAISDPATFAMLMLELNHVDGVIGGLVQPSADILRAGFKVIKPKPGIKTISSVMVMEKGSEWFIFSDISVNIMPNQDQLVDIAKNASVFANQLGLDDKVAFLSFSTNGSAVHERSTLIQKATDQFNQNHAHNLAIGEVQFDAAFVPQVRSAKYKKPAFDGPATIFVFPSLEAGNIGYKIAQRMGGFGAIGPIITGINKPVNDLSRGATNDDVYNTALVTALQTYQ